MTDAEFAQLIASAAHTAERFAEIEGGRPAPPTDPDELRRIIDPK